MTSRNSSAHPLGSRCIDGDLEHHEWQSVSFVFETQLLDEHGRVVVRQPDNENARVYFICMKCRGFTYAEFEWVGYYLGDPAYGRGEREVFEDDEPEDTDQPAIRATPNARSCE